MMKTSRVWIVLKAILFYCMKYRPYMTVWIIVCVFGSAVQSVRAQNIIVLPLGVLLGILPAIAKKILLTISRIGGPNKYDEKLFGSGPQGRFTNYLMGYLNNYKE